MDEQKMVINRETAMRIWSKRYGKELKVTDFAGRIMVKSAYDDRDSKFGWNIDHILPQSKGGKTAEHNLVCCHILTNDEKADKFPCFNANGHEFEILKVQNHYEIKERSSSNSNNEEQSENNKISTNYYDSASAIRLYKEFKGFQTKKRFVGTIEIIIYGIGGADTAVTDFIEDMFIENDVQFVDARNDYSGTNVRILIKDYEMPDNENTNKLVDKCVLLNTYMSCYFKPLDIIEDYFIQLRLDCYNNRKDFYSKDGRVGFVDAREFNKESRMKFNSLAIQNSYAKKKFNGDVGWDGNLFYDYNYIWTDLSDDLDKEVSRQG